MLLSHGGEIVDDRLVVSQSHLHSEELLRQAAEGNKPALDMLLTRHLPGLRAFVRLRMGKMIRAREASCDLVQSVAREVLQRADRFKHGGETGFKQWLYKTAQRKIANRAEYWQAGRRDVAREASHLTGTSGGADQDLLQCYRTMCSPSHLAVVREELHSVEEAFDKLPDHYREVILQARVMGFSRAEIAAQSGRSEGAVRTLLFRAQAQFAAILAEVDL